MDSPAIPALDRRNDPTPPSRLFGTDGIRGPAGIAPLDKVSLHRLGRALGKLLKESDSAPSALLAGDTRRSTPDICSWLAEGLEQSGCQTVYGGVLPTPAVSRLAKTRAFTVGIAVSASHNPFPDNGVKLLDASGFKWSRKAESELERWFAEEPELPSDSTEATRQLQTHDGLSDQYLDELTSLFPNRTLKGMTIVLDAAHGAASDLAGDFFERLGAQVDVFGDSPDGANINLACGSTHPEPAIARTLDRRAHVGFAFDGDADRALAIDEKGKLHDGDAMLYALAIWMSRDGKLEPAQLVATSMSNLGLETALEREGIGLLRCDVGDRAVVEMLRSEGLVLGGEQSGHIVQLALAATGDGLLSAALLAQAVNSSGRSLSELTAGFHRFPQILRNVQVASKPEFDSLPEVVNEVKRVEKILGATGRLVLRYSGTEPLARVMIEGPDQGQIDELAEALATTIVNAIESLGSSS